MTEAEIQADYKAKLWWLYFPSMWRNLGQAEDARRNIAFWESELQKVREKTVGGARRGRKPGSKNKPKPEVRVDSPTLAIMAGGVTVEVEAA